MSTYQIKWLTCKIISKWPSHLYKWNVLDILMFYSIINQTLSLYISFFIVCWYKEKSWWKKNEVNVVCFSFVFTYSLFNMQREATQKERIEYNVNSWWCLLCTVHLFKWAFTSINLFISFFFLIARQKKKKRERIL